MYFLIFYWNPSRRIFEGLPIYWYSLFFALGFLLGYQVFLNLLKNYFSRFPSLHRSDIKDFDLLRSYIENPKKDQKEVIKKTHIKKGISKRELLKVLGKAFKEREDKLFFRKFLEGKFPGVFYDFKGKAKYIAEKVFLYIVIATIIGARVGNIIFYEDLSYYLKHPIEIINFWNGGIAGLASHGAAFFIVVSVFILAYRIRDFYPRLGVLRLFDFISIPTALAAVFIRIGNFFNQEILGSKSEAVFAVFFGNPVDGIMAPRHPVQLYEAFSYLAIFFLLRFLGVKKEMLLKRGKIFSLFLVFVFLARFFIEFLKVRQSPLVEGFPLSMGQLLSIPFILIGGLLFFLKK